MPITRRKGRKPLYAGAVAHVASRVAAAAVRRYGPRAAVAAGVAGAGYAGAKSLVGRKRSTVNKANYRKASIKGAGKDQYTQQSYTSMSKGRPMKSSTLVDRAVKADISRTVYQFRRYVNDGNNTNNFGYGFGQNTFGNTRYLPIVLFDLTRIRQDTIAPGAIGSGTFAKQAIMDTTGTDDGLIKWLDIQGQGADGSTLDAYPFISESKNISSELHPIRKSILSWVSIKLNLMGARNRPGWFKVQIVTFNNDEHLDPWTAVGPGQHNTFWTDQAARLTCNSIHDLPKKTNQKMKVLMEKKILFQPTSTTESDPRGHVDTVSMFYRPNKTMNYFDGGNIPKLGDDVQIAVTNVAGTARGTGISDFASNGKIYLLVTAFNPYTAAAFDPNIHPSIEWNIKTSHVSLDS